MRLFVPKSARAQALVGLAGFFFLVRQADFETSLAAALEDAQNVARLRNLPTRQRIEKRQEAFERLLLARRSRDLE